MLHADPDESALGRARDRILDAEPGRELYVGNSSRTTACRPASSCGRTTPRPVPVASSARSASSLSTTTATSSSSTERVAQANGGRSSSRPDRGRRQGQAPLPHERVGLRSGVPRDRRAFRHESTKTAMASPAARASARSARTPASTSTAPIRAARLSDNLLRIKGPRTRWCPRSAPAKLVTRRIQRTVHGCRRPRDSLETTG